MRRIKNYALVALAFSLVFTGCVDVEDDKYARPDWLAGKVFTQLADSSIFDTFEECLRLTGFDTIINTSGSYTVFAPNNEAFDLYFQGHPTYNSVSDIPLDELKSIVKYHLVQNPWTKEQLRSLDVWGWIDPKDETNDEPRGFKRETLLEDENRRYGCLLEDDEDLKIVDTLNTQKFWTRRVVTDSRKFVPVFFKEYFDIYDLTLNDFTFYFGRSFEQADDIFYLDARIIGNEIFAENGFIYNVDRVIEPSKNAYQLLEAEYDDKSYSRFLELVNLFPEFDYNEQETFDQPGAELGLQVDSLFDLTFPDLAFHLTKERTKAPDGIPNLPGNVTIRYHHGIIAPTNQAIQKLNNDYLAGGDFWNGVENAPINIKRIVVNTHLMQNAVYETDIQQGIINGEKDEVTLDIASIVQKDYGSNAAFIGVNDPIVPRAFSSVAGPVYLRKGFSRTMIAIEESGLLPALKRDRLPEDHYMLFVESDVNCTLDSSLLYDEFANNFFLYTTGPSARYYNISLTDLRNLLMNHIAAHPPSNNGANKEFILNLAGNYLVFDHVTGEVRGTATSSEGYRGATKKVYPKRIDKNASNGTTWEIDDWFSFSTSSLRIRMINNFPAFHSLIVKAGLDQEKLAKYSFISESEIYTIFAPSDSALQVAQADTLTGDDLKNFIYTHFVRRAIVFTDGNSTPGYYESLLPQSSSSNQFINFFIDTSIPDQISILDNSGGTYTTIPESTSTNILAGKVLTEGAATYPTMLNNAVIHKLDKVLYYTELDTN